MTRPPILLLAGLLAAGLALPALLRHPATAADAQAAPSPGAVAEAGAEVMAFEEFILESGPLCRSAPSTRCVGEGWRFADGNGDGRVSLDELKSVRAALVSWTRWRGDSLRAAERLGIHGGVWLVDTVGLDGLFASYDTNGDQSLSMAELLADIDLDQRPLGAVLLDPEAVDRQALSGRLGKFAPMLGALLRKY